MSIKAISYTNEQINYITLLNNLPGLVYRCLNNSTMDFTFVSAGAFQLTGYNPSEFAFDSSVKFSSIIHKNDLIDSVEEKRIQLLKKGVYNCQYRITHKDGQTIWVTDQGQGYYDELGEITHLEGHITENHNISKVIEQYTENIEELYSNREKFFSIIAHDLRSPFNAIIGFSSLLKSNFNKYNKETIEKYINLIYESTTRAHTLLENLLEWSRVHSGKISFNPQKISFPDLCNEQITILNDCIIDKTLKIKYDFDNTEVYADQNMLMFIIRNLLSNAIKFSYKGGLISISANDHNNYTNIHITDEGTGISQDLLLKLFSHNHIQSKKGTMGEKGTGLGLILCKEFTEKHNGFITVMSTEGKGSTFTVSLPMNDNNKV
jgi:two-component system sensor histidine kinase/response regulator